MEECSLMRAARTLLVFAAISCFAENGRTEETRTIAVLPRGTEIILVMADGHIYVVDPSSGDVAEWTVQQQTQTRSSVIGQFPAIDWSSTRQQLLLQSNASVTTITPAGQEQDLPIQAPPDLWHPFDGMDSYAWSPDGRELAFRIYTRDKHDKLYDGLYTQAATGSTPKYLASQGDEPSWSPDGSRIAFVAYDNNGLYLRTVAPDGTGLVTLARERDSNFSHIWSPRWSPDGKKIAFAVANGPTSSSIALVDLISGQRKQLFYYATEFPSSSLDWSPSGDRLVFASKKGSSCKFNLFNFGPGGVVACHHDRLYTMRADGTDIEPLGQREFGHVDKLMWIRIQ